MSEKRTIESFLKELRKDHSEKAIANFIDQDRDLTKMVNSYHAAIMEFSWSKSKEGANYWCTVHDDLRDGLYLFPPQPVNEETQGGQDKMIAEFMSVFGLSFKSKKWTDEIEIIKSKFILQRK